MSEHNCANCKMRARYDQKPKSLLGRFWRWHIGWCPGWKKYYQSLPENEKKGVTSQYGL